MGIAISIPSEGKNPISFKLTERGVKNEMINIKRSNLIIDIKVKIIKKGSTIKK